MASQLDTVITFDQACDQFTDCILPAVQERFEQDGEPNIPARSEAWSNYVDSLWQNQQISDWQLEHWEHPDCTEEQ